jgi:hypothetical protein
MPETFENQNNEPQNSAPVESELDQLFEQSDQLTESGGETVSLDEFNHMKQLDLPSLVDYLNDRFNFGLNLDQLPPESHVEIDPASNQDQVVVTVMGGVLRDMTFPGLQEEVSLSRPDPLPINITSASFYLKPGEAPYFHIILG